MRGGCPDGTDRGRVHWKGRGSILLGFRALEHLRVWAPGFASGSSGPLAYAARIQAQAVSSLISGTPPTRHAQCESLVWRPGVRVGDEGSTYLPAAVVSLASGATVVFDGLYKLL